MPTVWLALKKSLHCNTSPAEVHDPRIRRGQPGAIITRRRPACRPLSGCSRSIASIRDVIHGSKRGMEKPPSCSPRSIGSSDFLNPIAHEVIVSNSTCELKITGFGAGREDDASATFVGTLRPGTPGPGGKASLYPARRPPPLLLSDTGARPPSTRRAPPPQPSHDSAMCHKCGEQFGKWEALEAHHLSKHAVSELVEGDSSRKIVEIICRTSWLKTESSCGKIEKVLKVHNMQRTLSRFEEYRESVKHRASKLPKKHPRCLADGNELLRFHGATIQCSLGINNSTSLCISDKCSICRIIRHGFSINKEIKGGVGVGVFTASTSGRAFDSINIYGNDDDEGRNRTTRKALLVCRVIAGRVHRPLDNFQELSGQSGFDSLAGKVGPYANIEELYLLNPRALLPCFVVMCKS